MDKYFGLSNEEKQSHMNLRNKYRDNLRKSPDLRNLFIEMTVACNEHCLHCGSNCGDVKPANMLTDDEIFNCLEKLKNQLIADEKKLPFISITGGEPLLRKSLPELMKRISSLGYKWGMTSNGTLIDSEMAKKLKDAGMYSIGLSLDGLEHTNDWFRQTEGSYKKTLEAVDNLIDAEIENVMITTVVFKKNIGQLDDIKRVVKEHKCKTWRIINIDPIGRAQNNPYLILNNNEYKYILEYIVSNQTDPDLDIFYSCNHYAGLDYERKIRHWYFMCAAGISIASIQYNGNISACLDIERRDDLTFGNIREDDFYDRWLNGFEIFRTDKTEKSEKCRDCSERENCQGNGWHTWDYDRWEPKICMYEKVQ